MRVCARRHRCRGLGLSASAYRPRSALPMATDGKGSSPYGRLVKVGLGKDCGLGKGVDGCQVSRFARTEHVWGKCILVVAWRVY